MALPGGDTRINGTRGNDVLLGTSGNDLIRGFAGLDSIDGVDGNDYLEGNLGNDTLMGGAGDDWLMGGAGNDLYIGGAGADQFRFYAYNITGAGTTNPGEDIDTVEDLSFGDRDVIVLADFSAGTFSGNSRTGDLNIVNTGQGPGSGSNIRSWAGLVDLVASSPAVTAAQRPNTNTLLLRIQNGDGTVQTIAIENGWSIYAGLINQAPSPADDLSPASADGTVSGNVLANDTDPDLGDALTVTGIKSAGGPVLPVSSDGSTVVEATFGILTLLADGSYSFQATGSAAQALAKGALGQDVFTYTVTDSGGKTATAQLVIDVTGTNDAPVAKALGGNVSEDGSAIGFQADFEDVDQGDTHDVTVDSSGTIGKVVLHADGTFSYDPNGKFNSLRAGQDTTDTFSYTVTDADGGTSTKTVTVTILGANDAPIAQALTGTASEDGPAISFTPTFEDVDNGDKHSVSVDTAGTLGKAKVNADGTISYDPDGKFNSLSQGQTATDTFTYTVTDSQGAISTASVTVTIEGVNDKPVAQAIAGTTSENGPAITLTPDFEDVDAGDKPSFSIDTTGTLGKVVLNDDGTFSYDANGKFESLKAGQTGTDTFTYTVTDSHGESSTKTATVTILGVNDDPTALSDFNGVVKNGKLSVAAANGVLANDRDVEGDTLSVSAINGSTSLVGAAAQGKYGVLTMKADGSYTYAATTKSGALPAKAVAQDHFTYSVSDGLGGVQTETLILTVFQKGQTYVRGSDGANSLTGGNAADVLDGGNGNDTLSGGNGADVLLGGRGNDFLTGGAGADTFVFNANFGRDVITDFTKGLDAIQFDKNVFADFASLLASAQQSGNDVIIQAGAENTITLKNFLLSNLNNADFLFI